MFLYRNSSIFRTLAATGLIGMAGVFGWCAVPNAYLAQPDLRLAPYEIVFDQIPTHISEFAPLAPPLAPPTCELTRPPEALATPDPLLVLEDSPVRVSFIVDAQGRVQSPFILESAGTTGDAVILRAVRYWRFRPALCNGVPTEMEARVRFTAQSNSK